jgi:hypothetical protein
MKVELTAVTLEGLQIFGAKTQRHLTQDESVIASFLFGVNFPCYSIGLDQISEMLECIFLC